MSTTQTKPAPSTEIVKVQGQDLMAHLQATGKIDMIQELLAGVMDSKQFIRVFMNCIAGNTDIQKCNISSIIQCICYAAECGLELGGALGEAYIVPFGGVATFMPGYRGLVRLVREHPDIRNITAELVHENDTCKITKGTDGDYVHHELDLNRGEITPKNCKGVYTKLEYMSGHCEVLWVSAEEIEKAHQRGTAAKSPAWRDYWGEMAKKFAIKRHSKTAPKSTRMSRAVELDNTIDAQFTEDAPVNRTAGVDRVGSKLRNVTGDAKVTNAAPVQQEAKPAGGVPFYVCPECNHKEGWVHKASCSQKGKVEPPADEPAEEQEPATNEEAVIEAEVVAPEPTELDDEEEKANLLAAIYKQFPDKSATLITSKIAVAIGMERPRPKPEDYNNDELKQACQHFIDTAEG